MMHAAQSNVYATTNPDNAKKLWRQWTEQVSPRPIALPVKGALLAFNGQPVDFATLRAQLSGALGRGLVAS